MDDVEKVILNYLKSRNDGWVWIFGAKKFGKKETIKLFRKDKKFRKFITTEVLKTATDLFIRAAEKGKK